MESTKCGPEEVGLKIFKKCVLNAVVGVRNADSNLRNEGVGAQNKDCGVENKGVGVLKWDRGVRREACGLSDSGFELKKKPLPVWNEERRLGKTDGGVSNPSRRPLDLAAYVRDSDGGVSGTAGLALLNRRSKVARPDFKPAPKCARPTSS